MKVFWTTSSVGAIWRIAHRKLHHAMPVFAHQEVKSAAIARLGAHHEPSIPSIDVHKQSLKVEREPLGLKDH
jgi:hypothetical protein